MVRQGFEPATPVTECQRSKSLSSWESHSKVRHLVCIPESGGWPMHNTALRVVWGGLYSRTNTWTGHSPRVNMLIIWCVAV